MSSESFYPHAFLLQPSSSQTILVSGPHVKVLDTQTGNVLKSTFQSEPALPQDEGQAEAKKKKEKGAAQPPVPFVRCAALGGPNGTSTFLATAGDDKVLRVYEVGDLKLLNERELPKRPTDIRFTKDGETIVVGDKFGDIFSYPLHHEPAPEPTEPTQKSRDSVVSHENPSNGTLILGHTSLLIAFLFSPDEKYIITADRDEHIRVSWYPQGYVIENFCLGHKKYVTALHIPPFSPSHLVSGGGDSFLGIWDWQSGKLVHQIHGIQEAAEPYIKVQSRKRKNWDGRDDEGEGNLKGKRGKKRKQRGKKNPNKKAGEEEETQDAEMEEQSVAPEDADEVASQQAGAPADADKKILVISKITTVASEDGSRHIVFNAVGTTALFAVPYPNLENLQAQTSTPAIISFDLGFPVVDFSVTENGHIWTLLDGNWNPENSQSSTSQKWARTLKLTPSGQLEVTSSSNSLLDALNSECLIPTTPETLQKLDLYSDITSLPKWSGPDSGEAEDSEIAGTPLDTPTPSFASPSEIAMVGEGGKGAGSLSKRLLGRQRKKDAVNQRLQQSASATPRPETPVDEPEHKRARTEEEEQKEGADVAMQES